MEQHTDTDTGMDNYMNMECVECIYKVITVLTLFEANRCSVSKTLDCVCRSVHVCVYGSECVYV